MMNNAEDANSPVEKSQSSSAMFAISFQTDNNAPDFLALTTQRQCLSTPLEDLFI